MADELKMLEELEALEKAATEGPWLAMSRHEEANRSRSEIRDIMRRRGVLRYVVCDDNPTDIILAVEARNALPTLLRLARRGLAAGEVVEVVKEYLDGGNIIAPSRLDAALSRLAEMEER